MISYIKSKLPSCSDYAISIGKWLIVAAITGAIGAPIGTAFHISVDWANEMFHAHSLLIFLAPISGLLIAALYTAAGMKESAGTDEVIGSVRTGKPLRLIMAPLIFISTVLTHMVGGSAGREGAALQLGGSIGTRIGKWLRLSETDMRIVTLCGMSALFSSLFCTPLTAVFFAVEVVSVGVMYYAALFPCMLASLLSYALSLLLGAKPMSFAPQSPTLTVDTLWRTALLAALCALVSVVFCVSIRESHRFFKRAFPNPFWRIAIGGVALILLTFLSRTNDYNSAGMNVVYQAVNNGTAVPTAFLWKILFTAVTIGCGFKGGEIVPTMFIGSTFGCVVGGAIGLDPTFGAAIGLIAVFCGVVNCPIASIILSVELFGSSALLLFAPTCIISYLLSGNFGLYHTQKIVYSKLRAQYINRSAK